MTQSLTPTELAKRIALQPPYFALTHVESRGAASASGCFHAEQSIGNERGPVAAGELARHLATLGACAAVLANPTAPTYYLGTKGRLKLSRDASPDHAKSTFVAFSEVLAQDRKSLVTHSTFGNGKELAQLHCTYQALPEAVFARTFKQYRTPPVPAPPSSPYREPIELDFQAPQGQSLVAHSRPLPPVRFAGHFLEYPTWPASLYAETVSRVAARLLHHMLDKEVDFTVVRMDIDALRLISGLESVSFHVNCVSASKLRSHYVFSSEVRKDDTVAATMEMEVYV